MGLNLDGRAGARDLPCRSVVPRFAALGTEGSVRRHASQRFEEEMDHQRRLEVMGQLTAGVAHDFNNLLTAIMGNLTLLMDRLEDRQSRRLARRSMSAAAHAATLTKRLLAFSRRQQLRARRVNINRFIAGVAPRLRDIGGPAIQIEVVASAANALVVLEPIQLELALFNLVTNARDAMPDGGRIIIETNRVNGLDRYPNVPPGHWGVICVTDNGCGMRPHVLARAFEPFFTTKRVGVGTGLGLSMVRDVVKHLGGEIAIQSELGAGTSVLIYLPAEPRRQLEQEERVTLR
jgi:signal transduction histidine kinase